MAHNCPGGCSKLGGYQIPTVSAGEINEFGFHPKPLQHRQMAMSWLVVIDAIDVKLESTHHSQTHHLNYFTSSDPHHGISRHKFGYIYILYIIYIIYIDIF